MDWIGALEVSEAVTVGVGGVLDDEDDDVVDVEAVAAVVVVDDWIGGDVV